MSGGTSCAAERMNIIDSLPATGRCRDVAFEAHPAPRRRSGRTPVFRRTGAVVKLLTCLLLLTAPGLAVKASDVPDASVNQVLEAVVALRSTVPPQARTARTLGTERAGSAIVIDANGLLLTIGYLILEADSVEVELHTGAVVPARVLAYDHRTGLGLLRAIRPLDVTPVPLGDSASAVASTRAVVASHGGLLAARPAFVVSRREFVGFWEYLLDEALFTSPPHPRFSGAALIGPGGNLLGVGSLLVNDAMPGERQLPGNVFVPIDLLKPILGELLLEGRTSDPDFPWLGIYSDDQAGPVIVGSLADNGPAAKAGVEPGDAIVGVGNEPVTTVAAMYRKVWELGGPGTEVPLNILRGDQMQNITIVAGDRYDWLRLPHREQD